jgi:PAS domain S-box-containing protein
MFHDRDGQDQSGKAMATGAWIVGLAGICALSAYSFLLFHSVVELFSIAVAFGTFFVAWNTRRLIENGYLLTLGIAFLFVGFVDLLQGLAYRGTEAFPGHQADELSACLWLVARSLQVAAVLGGLFFIRRRAPSELLFPGFLALTITLLGLVFSGNFPACSGPGGTLTPFGIFSEYAFCVALVVGTACIYRNRHEFDPAIAHYLLLFLIFLTVAELFFALSEDAYGGSSLLGHLAKLTAYVCLYKTLIQTGLSRPYAALFRKLQTAETKYRSIFEHAPMGIFRSTLQGRYLEANPAYATLMGFSSPEQMLRDVHDIGQQAYGAPEQRQAIVDSLSGDSRYSKFECIMRRRDGSCFNARLYIKRIENGDDDLLEAIVLDVSEEKRVMMELEYERTKFTDMVHNSPDHIIRYDADLNRLYINPAVEKAFAIRAKDFLYRSHREIPMPNGANVSIFAQALQNVFQSGMEGSLEQELHTVHGKVHLDMRLSPELGPSGEVKSVLMSGRDVTSFRALEQQLRQAKETAESASMAKSEFLANMSHEIRTPISGILGMTEMLGKSELDDKQQQCLDMISDSATSLLTIINDILDLSKIEARKFELKPVDFDLVEVMSKTLAPFQVTAEGKGLSLWMEVPDGLPEAVHGDPDRLAQIIKNLVSNAIKFTEQGNIKIRAHLAADLGDGVEILFSVSDTGTGIPKDKVDGLFKKFSQLDGSYSKQHGGTGLGLAISKNLAELMGGRIWVVSEPGTGSTFFFTLCFKNTKATLRKAFTLPDPAECRETARCKNLDILLAEDNMVNQMFMEEFLVEAGHRPVIAENGQKVLELLKRQSFDLVLMDIQMPEMDGLEATRHIRTCSEEYVGIPIIALTAFAMKGDRERIMSAGIDGYVSKPVQFDELYSVIEHVLDERKRGALGFLDCLDNVSEELMDNQTLRNRFDDKCHLLPGLVDSFLQQLAKQEEKIIQAVEHKNRHDLHHIVADLAGLAGLMGAVGVGKSARKTAFLLTDSDSEEECVQELRHMIRCTVEALQSCHIK